jgi:Mg/Co/Ni transporter MgtE
MTYEQNLNANAAKLLKTLDSLSLIYLFCVLKRNNSPAIFLELEKNIGAARELVNDITNYKESTK